MADTELNLLIQLKDNATAQLRQMNAEIQTNAKAWSNNYAAIQSGLQQTGIAFTAFGAAVTGALAYSFKAFEDERLVFASLTNTLQNVGVSFASVESDINNFTEANRKSTNFSTGEQIAGLDQLILTTGNYQEAMKLLPTAMDLAAKKHMDLTDAARLLGRVAEGDINALNRYGFSMDGVSSSGAALKIIQDKLTGSAQDAVSPFTVLKNTLEKLAEKIGELISGPAGKVIKWLTDAADAAIAWADKNPELAKTLVEVAGAIGIAAVAVGIFALVFVGAMTIIKLFGGPVGWLIILIELLATALIAAGIYIALNWTSISHNLAKIWNDMGLAFMDVADGIVSGVEWMVNMIIKGVNMAIGALNSIAGVKIPEISLWHSVRWADLFERKNMDWYKEPGAAGTSGTGATGTAPVYPINQFGNYGNTGQTGVMTNGGTNITFNIAGDVTSDKDFFEKVRQYFIQLGYKNVTTGIK